MYNKVLILGMIFAGSALMVLNIIRYCAFARFLRKDRGWKEENRILNIPIILLALFLAGYIIVGVFGDPDIIMAGILFGGSIFVFIILIVMRRITDKVIEQERLKMALREAKQANKAKSVFLSNMSHDIRTPLNAIIGYTTLADREGGTVSVTLRQTGAGLGMAISKSIIDMMGGTIDVVTAPGEGSEFTVKVSFCECDDAACAQRRRAARAGSDAGGLWRGAKIMLVDDMQINREVAKMMLENEGFAVETAENGSDAVSKIKSSPAGHYAAVLMDIQMPVMDGYEATKLIRALDDPAKAGVPIVAVTANAFKEDIQKAEEAGMDGHISKPIAPEQMMGTLSKLLS